MKISIVTATYNSAKTVADTLKSVSMQDYQDWELIIEDGLSKDDTLAICERYRSVMGDRLKIYSEKDTGLYNAMNKGLSRATGDVVGILNSDDMFKDSGVLTHIYQVFQENPDTDAIYGNLIFVNPGDTSRLERVWRGSQYQPGAFQKGWSPAHPTFYCKRAVYEQYGTFNEDLPISSDFELMLRLIEVHRIKTLYTDRFFVRMRTGGESNGTLRNIIIGNKGILAAFRNNGIKVNPVLYVLRRLVPKVFGIIRLHIYMLVYRKR